MKKREKHIDLFKSILVLQMILCHVILLIGCSDNYIENKIVLYCELVCFSGFMFCFGYNVNNAYLHSDEKNVRYRILKNIIRTLLVFYISSFGYCLIKENNINVIDIIILRKTVNFTEYIASFVVIYIFVYIFLELLRMLSNNKKCMIIAMLLSISFPLIPSSTSESTWLGLIIGSKTNCFPIIKYMSLFLGGIYFSQYKPKYSIKFSAICMIEFALFIMGYKSKKLVERFPPELLWVIGSHVFVYIYYHILYELREKNNLEIINLIGKNTIAFLLISNLFLFALSLILVNQKLTTVIFIFIFTIYICYIYIWLKIKVKKIKEKKCAE